MLTASQIAAIIMLLQAFGVAPNVVELVRTEITPPIAQTSIPDTVTPESTAQAVSPVVVSPSNNVSQATTTPVALSVPVCNLYIQSHINKGQNQNGLTYAHLNWRVNSNARLTITSNRGFSWTPSFPTSVRELTDTHATSTEVFTLTETMTDPAYQTTTTCQATTTPDNL